MDLEKNKILHVVGHFLPLTCPWIMDQIENDLVESRIISFTADKNDDRLDNLKFDIFRNNIISYYIKLPYFLYKLKKTIDLVIGKYKIETIHVHFGVEGAFISFLNRLFFKKKLIISFYGMDYKLIDKTRYKFLFSLGKKFVNFYVVEGDYGKYELIKKGIVDNKIKIIKIGVQNKSIEKKYFPENLIRVTLATTFKEKKGVTYAAKALAELPLEIKNKIQLNLIGDGNLKEIFIETIGNGFKYLRNQGYISRSELFERLVETDIFLHPSIEVAGVDTEGGMPVVILEAAMAGSAIITTNICDIPLLIKNEINGILIDEKSSEKIKKYLIELVNEPKKIIKLGGEVHIDVKRNYSLENMKKNLSNLYHENK